MNATTIEALSGTALEFEFCRTLGKDVFGVPEGSFVVRENGLLLIFESETNPVTHASFSDGDTLYPLDVACGLNATLVAKDGLVTCEIGRVTATGNSYSEAAMRAIITHARTSDKG